MVSADLVNTYKTHPNKAMEVTEPFQEAIYDFGGANVKSCASIALSKSISKGLIPPGQWTYLSNQAQNPNLSLYQDNSKPSNFRGSYFQIIKKLFFFYNFSLIFGFHFCFQILVCPMKLYFQFAK